MLKLLSMRVSPTFRSSWKIQLDKAKSRKFWLRNIRAYILCFKRLLPFAFGIGIFFSFFMVRQQVLYYTFWLNKNHYIPTEITLDNASELTVISGGGIVISFRFQDLSVDSRPRYRSNYTDPNTVRSNEKDQNRYTGNIIGKLFGNH
ncbi:MAG: hypothetical protein U0930_09150 [Pirellulales bacterium]